MSAQSLFIGSIPALLWGPPAPRVYIAAHGDSASKSDPTIEVFAQTAAEKGWQVLSFDLPEHGQRKGEATLCKPQACLPEYAQVLAWAQERWTQLSFFGVSIGAWFGLLAYRQAPLQRALLLSPVIDMAPVIAGMMAAFGISEETLEEKGEIPTPMGKTLYRDYSRYVKQNPVLPWGIPTAILCGSEDNLNGAAAISAFATAQGYALTVMPGGEHYFHTPQQMAYFRRWAEENL